jgi:thiamine-monophosphate kinase
VDLDLLPVTEDAKELARSMGYDPAILAATGGEDYELVISAPGQILDALAESIEVPLTIIGEVTPKDVAFRRGEEPVDGLSGWDHFA